MTTSIPIVLRIESDLQACLRRASEFTYRPATASIWHSIETAVRKAEAIKPLSTPAFAANDERLRAQAA